ncbi:Hypothetical Protein SLY_0862 [Strawberry lethal yellows phytoplasma (CPA) str. NZSb11]|uniref:Uncharacterized protein n=1 Tax=Strawberry lethal yellows phytoplasma (CPA) str. NZSb11 TaxID=980422 RepID=R4RXY8_PHYAS|nr:Hypothetical Protein SLY_0862 [Strawberry lethal yellows phytoplasma (CPA) str. NZSb11]
MVVFPDIVDCFGSFLIIPSLILIYQNKAFIF